MLLIDVELYVKSFSKHSLSSDLCTQLGFNYALLKIHTMFSIGSLIIRGIVINRSIHLFSSICVLKDWLLCRPFSFGIILMVNVYAQQIALTWTYKRKLFSFF